MAMSVAELRAIASLDSKQFEMGVARVKQSIGGIASGQLKSVAGMVGGAFAVGAVVNFAKSTMAAADDVQDLAGALGVGVENLQGLQLAADRAGVSAEAMTGALQRIRKSQDDAIAGDKTLQEAFRNLGMSMADIQSMSPDRIFERISIALNDQNVTAREGAAAGDVLGRGYQSLAATMIDVSASGLDPMIAKMKEANQIMSEDSVNAAAAMQRAYETVATSAGNMGKRAITGTAIAHKTVTEFLKALAEGSDIEGARIRARFKVDEWIAGPKPPPRDAGEPGLSAEDKAQRDDDDKRFLKGLREEESYRKKSAMKNLEAAAAAEARMSPRDARKDSGVKLAMDQAKTAGASMYEILDVFDKIGEKETARVKKRQEIETEAFKDQQQLNLDRSMAIAGVNVGAPQAADRLARIGGIIGGQTDASKGIFERQLQEQEIIREYTTKQYDLEVRTHALLERNIQE